MAILGAALMGAGLLGSLTQKKPKYNMGAMDEAYRLIEKQYGDVNAYFNEAGTAFEGQYKTYYGQTMQDAVGAIAGSGIYESPVSENYLNRQRTALGEQYATGKSQLAGQKMSALGQIDQQKVTYYQNLANIQYQKQLQKQQSKSQMFGTIAGLGAALI
jgi:hypothetical protein